MTEIPEHLLARSRARREAAGLAEPADAAAATTPTTGGEVAVPGGASPAPSAAATPATQPATPPPPPPIKPDPPYVRAAKERKRIPYWAMPVLMLLPIWGLLYANTLEAPPVEGPLARGAKIYTAQCQSCHQAGGVGQGNSFPALTNGDTEATFPNYKDHIDWVKVGAAGHADTGTYGDPNRAGGQRSLGTFSGVMPAFGSTLTEAQIADVVRYEREVLSGGKPEPELVALTGGS
jgi:mono/diheme cytochrome c family protein